MGLFPNGDKEGDKDCGLRKRNEGDSARTVREFKLSTGSQQLMLLNAKGL